MEALIFSSTEVAELAGHFGALSEKVPLRPIADVAEYEEAVRVLNALLDVGAADETHPLAGLVTALGEFIVDFDDAHYSLPDAMPAEVLRALMDQHGIRQSELPEIGSQGVVSEILNGKRELNARQIRDVSKRFGVSPAVFFPA
ncbi:MULTISPECIES: helix-turn-helix domain-containing protein [Paraburkholderia]|jgi:HTH-type transcriptional regulator/antitoxin HigA|uniref:HTH-type transcriptional regulator / antitoxin HigA n=1 Tax=Paraburkholderia phenazinium TaxID=60549 RepID=A0A1N6E5R2_9BURK|nr:helix-turn-helix domain-containing protein [Paraburkholderia phenazinium]SIN78267.1 HTH-type transcriptional regulator / antitoxin HigA [Paraburkholderia phenazinium]